MSSRNLGGTVRSRFCPAFPPSASVGRSVSPRLSGRTWACGFHPGGIMRSRLRLFSALAGAFLLVAPQLGAQQITGRVTTQSGEPLAAVQVFIAGSGIGALSQQNGRY